MTSENKGEGKGAALAAIPPTADPAGHADGIAEIKSLLRALIHLQARDVALRARPETTEELDRLTVHRIAEAMSWAHGVAEGLSAQRVAEIKRQMLGLDAPVLPDPRAPEARSPAERRARAVERAKAAETNFAREVGDGIRRLGRLFRPLPDQPPGPPGHSSRTTRSDG